MMTARDLNTEMADYFESTALDEDRLAEQPAAGPGLDVDLPVERTRKLADALARIHAAEAGVSADAPEYEALIAAAVRTLIDGESVERPHCPTAVWGHEPQAAVAEAIAATSNYVVANHAMQRAGALHQAASRPDDKDMLAAAEVADETERGKTVTAARLLRAALRSLNVDELRAGRARVQSLWPVEGAPYLEGDVAHAAAATEWNEIFAAATDGRRWPGGPTDRTALIAARHDAVQALVDALDGARAERDKLICQATRTTSYRIHITTGLSKPAVGNIRDRDAGGTTLVQARRDLKAGSDDLSNIVKRHRHLGVPCSRVLIARDADVEGGSVERDADVVQAADLAEWLERLVDDGLVDASPAAARELARRIIAGENTWDAGPAGEMALHVTVLWRDVTGPERVQEP